MKSKITIVVSMLLWLLSSFSPAAGAETDIGEAHEKMQQAEPSRQRSPGGEVTRDSHRQSKMKTTGQCVNEHR